MHWELADIYPAFDSPEFKADFLAVPGLVDSMNTHEIAAFEDVAQVLRLLEEYTEKNDRLSSYSHFIYAADTADTDAAKFIYLLDVLRAETGRMKVRLADFLSRVKETGGDIDALAEQYGVAHYAFQLKHMADEFKHMMSEDEETLAALMSGTGAGAWSLLHEKLISTLTCEYNSPETGKTSVIGINECRNLAFSADAAVRKAAYEAELAAYPKIDEACAAALNSIKGEVNLLNGRRKFESPLARTLFDSNMTQKTLDAMFAAIDTDVQVLRDYLKLKAKHLGDGAAGAGEKGLAFYDIFAPMGSSADKTYSYEEAKAFVTENFGRFSPGMKDVAQMAFEKNWIDVYPREGKVGGAFCGDIYAIKQFRILLNFGGSLSDIITLAHELGHGYHTIQVMREGILNTNYPMPLAETASTFCEMIVTNAALKTLPPDARLQLVENSLQDATQVILDIYSRYLFEKSVFEARLEHPLSVRELNGLMLAAQRAAYGDGLDHKLLHPYMWVIKPHYYSAGLSFYNFPYAFGHLMAGGMYKIYEADPAGFGKKYDNFLQVSGKMSVEESCAELGIDIQSPAFWQSALGVVKSQFIQFKELLA